MNYTDIRVRTKAPELLDQTIQQLPGVQAVVVEGTYDGDVCIVRCFGNVGFLRYALASNITDSSVSGCMANSTQLL